MPTYQSRKRKYTSRSERLRRLTRVFRLVGAFVLIGLLALFIFRRRAIADWVSTFFMD